MTLKVAFLADSFLMDESTGVNGTQVQMYNLAIALAARGVEVHYLALTRNFQESYSVHKDVQVHWFRYQKGLFAWRHDHQRYLTALDSIRPDALYVRGRNIFLYTAYEWCRNINKRCIWGINGENGCEFWKYTRLLWRSSRSILTKIGFTLPQFLLDWLIHKGMRSANSVVTQTQYQNARLRMNFSREGILLPSFFPIPEGNPGEKKPIILWLANLSPNKQPELFLDLATRCRTLPDWRFVLAGGTRNTAYAESLRNTAAKATNLEMIGPVPFLLSSQYYGSARLFVNTSSREADGLPNAFIQSWLHGAPVFSLNHDPNGWIETEDLGFCSHGDFDLLVEKVLNTLGNPDMLVAMGERAGCFAREKFCNEKTITAFIRLFGGEPEVQVIALSQDNAN